MEFLFNLSNRQNELLYFKMKNKYGYCFTDEEQQEFILTSHNWLKSKVADYDAIVIPQTSNKCLANIVSNLGKEVITLNKCNNEELKRLLEKQKFMKSEKIKLFNSIQEEGAVKIATIAGNQRKRFNEILFKPVDIDGEKRYALVDDSVFSGTTIKAMEHLFKGTSHDTFVLFNKMV